MSWNYRVVHTTKGGVEAFAIYEVFYDDLGEPEARTEYPSYPAGETLAALVDDFRWYQQALQQRVLEDSVLSRHVPG
jgi:hypothetical protein